MNKRILFLTGESPDAPGGMEHVIRELKRGLEWRGYRIEVLHRHNSAPGWVARPKHKWQAYSADLFLGWYLGRTVSDRMGEEVQAILSNSVFGWYLPGVPPRVKKIHMYHGTYRGVSSAIRPFISAFGAFKLKWWDSMTLERLSGRGKTMLCNSDQTRHEVQKYFGYEATTVWLPLDTEHFRPLDRSAARVALSLSQADDIGMFVGSTQPSKGFPIVRSLIQLLPGVKWILALRGEVPDDLKNNPDINVFQNASPEILPALYNAADFTVCPSRYEPFGYVVAEALACGTPAIASPGGASCLFLAGAPFTTLLVPSADNLNKFYLAAREVLRDPEYYRRCVIERIRPKIVGTMSSAIWMDNFCELLGL
jgi:glycosyltransferase involved in cell wall biosynthesis